MRLWCLYLYKKNNGRNEIDEIIIRCNNSSLSCNQLVSNYSISVLSRSLKIDEEVNCKLLKMNER